ncbi:MAG: hypothetical protein HYX28_01550 [Candidatus Koribacter versatilis]|uniref:MucB/RseB N-terminal domain-containing protein n=1 Tax=Candidatus Korobacter versatilis TaxID=658062 RepID=A0A932A784_9BACT|nr:hypothetical protein [Candidatus Koribacter versatilis]
MHRRLTIFGLTIVLSLAALPTWAQNSAANELVRRAIANEDRASSGGPRYMYRLRTEKPERTVVKDLIETNDGVIARLVSVNDKPPTSEQRAADDKKLEKILHDPKEQKQRREEQRKDEERSRQMVKALPDAFLYDFDGKDVIAGVPVTRLRFWPNPNFDPPARETMVYRGMQGHMWIEPTEERLVKMDAQLFDDVTFGWGILGRLNKGGRFAIEQSKIGPGRWETTKMDLDFVGKALMFKTIKIKEVETASAFRPVPPNLTLAQGVELLRKSDQLVAERSAAAVQPR